MSERKLVRHIGYVITTVFNGPVQKTHVYLSDSNEVLMNSASILKFDAGYKISEPIITWTGHPFFNVGTNHEKPFIARLYQSTVSSSSIGFYVLSYSNEDRTETTPEVGKVQDKVRGQASLSRIGRRYYVIFEIRNADLFNLKYTGSFIDETFDEGIKLFKSVSPISCKINIRSPVTNKQYLKPKIN